MREIGLTLMTWISGQDDVIQECGYHDIDGLEGGHDIDLLLRLVTNI
jgi:hypothetical protein